MKNYSNVGIVWEPHFQTNRVRVAVSSQKGDKNNYVIICCSPTYNGLYRYPVSNVNKYQVWMNNHKPCYEIPVMDLEYVKPLEDIQDESVRKLVIKQQNAWCKLYREKV